jgi:SAM-dependent methyltransferase
MSATRSGVFFTDGISYGDGRPKHFWVDPRAAVPDGQGRLLELGSGQGETRQPFEAKGYTWIGLDIEARNAPSVVGDAQRLPFRDGTFAVVYSSQVFEHLRHPWSAAAEVFRVLEPGGLFCGSVSCLEPFHDSYFNYTHWGLETLLREAGLTPTRIEAGPSAFLVILHHMLDAAGPGVAQRVVRVTARPGVWLLRVGGRAFIRWRHGRRSPQMAKLDGYFAKFALRFAGHLHFTAVKGAGPRRPAPAAAAAVRDTVRTEP